MQNEPIFSRFDCLKLQQWYAFVLNNDSFLCWLFRLYPHEKQPFFLEVSEERDNQVFTFTHVIVEFWDRVCRRYSRYLKVFVKDFMIDDCVFQSAQLLTHFTMFLTFGIQRSDYLLQLVIFYDQLFFQIQHDY